MAAFNETVVQEEEKPFSCATVSINGPDADIFFRVSAIWRRGTFFNYFIGLVGNIICLLAFKRQAKINKAYYHQLSVIVSDILGSLFATFAEFGYLFCNVWSKSPVTFLHHSPVLSRLSAMSYSCRQVAQIAVTILLCGITLDRWYGTQKPMKYYHLNHKVRAVLFFFASYILSCGINVSELMMVEVSWDANASIYFAHYTYVTQNVAFYYLNILNNFMRVAILVILLVVITGFTVAYRKMVKTLVSTGKSTRWATKSEKSEQEKPTDQRTLAILLFGQCFLISADTAFSLAFRVIVFMFHIPWCFKLAVGLDDFGLQSLNSIQLSWNFLIYLGISKEFRKTVAAVLTRKPIDVHTTSITGRSTGVAHTQPVARSAPAQNGNMYEQVEEIT